MITPSRRDPEVATVVARAEDAGAHATHRPFSYEDLRRFLFLVLTLFVLYWLVSSLARTLLLFVVVGFLAMVLNPLVVWLEKRGMRRVFAVLITMTGLLAVLVGVGFLVVPATVSQINQLVENRATYTESIENQFSAVIDRFPQIRDALPPELQESGRLQLQEIVDFYTPSLSETLTRLGPGVGNRVLQVSKGLFSALVTGIFAFLILVFMLLNPQPIVAGFLSAVPERHRDAAGRTFARVEEKMVAWIRATLINGALTGIFTAALLYFVGLPSVVVFGVLAFLGEFVPNIGPLVASLPALFVAAGEGVPKLLWTIAAILFVQQVSSSVWVPLIMGRELDLHPVSIIFFALAMGSLFGLAGAILAVPAVVVIKIAFDEFYLKPNKVDRELIAAQADHVVAERKWVDLLKPNEEQGDETHLRDEQEAKLHENS